MRCLLIILFLGITFTTQGQKKDHSIVTLYLKPLWSEDDFFSVKLIYKNLETYVCNFKISQNDTSDCGTDGAEGLVAVIHYGNDSLIVPYTNMPYCQMHYIPIKSPKGKTIYRLHFNGVAYNEENCPEL